MKKYKIRIQSLASETHFIRFISRIFRKQLNASNKYIKRYGCQQCILMCTRMYLCSVCVRGSARMSVALCSRKIPHQKFTSLYVFVWQRVCSLFVFVPQTQKKLGKWYRNQPHMSGRYGAQICCENSHQKLSCYRKEFYILTWILLIALQIIRVLGAGNRELGAGSRELNIGG